MSLFIFLASFLALNFLFASAALAHCPLCIAGAGFGLSLSRLLGIDDSITGVWLAAFFGATAFWFSTFPLRQIRFPFKKDIVYLAVLASTLWSLYRFNLVDLHVGNILGFPKLTFGYLVGSVVFYVVDITSTFLIKIHRGVFFPYQRVIVSLGSILILSLFNYILINYFI